MCELGAGTKARGEGYGGGALSRARTLSAQYNVHAASSFFVFFHFSALNAAYTDGYLAFLVYTSVSVATPKCVCGAAVAPPPAPPPPPSSTAPASPVEGVAAAPSPEPVLPTSSPSSLLHGVPRASPSLSPPSRLPPTATSSKPCGDAEARLPDALAAPPLLLLPPLACGDLVATGDARGIGEDLALEPPSMARALASAARRLLGRRMLAGSRPCGDVAQAMPPSERLVMGLARAVLMGDVMGLRGAAELCGRCCTGECDGALRAPASTDRAALSRTCQHTPQSHAVVNQVQGPASAHHNAHVPEASGVTMGLADKFERAALPSKGGTTTLPCASVATASGAGPACVPASCTRGADGGRERDMARGSHVAAQSRSSAHHQ